MLARLGLARHRSKAVARVCGQIREAKPQGRPQSTFAANLGKITGNDLAGKSVTDSVIEALILDLLEWLAEGDRTYEEVMNAWRTSCPRLTVWEDANDRGLITTNDMNGRKLIRPSLSGLALLKQRTPDRRLQ
jgi:hypothetical protein